MVFDFNVKEVPDLSLIGGKARSLIEATKAGFPVPEGFVLSTDFFTAWNEKIKSTNAWKAFIVSPSRENCDALKKEAGELVMDGIQKKKLSEALRPFKTNEIFAVRSSSPEEDLQGMSFAGGYETTLGVTPSGIESAIIDSFVSMLDFRVVEYKRKNNMGIANPRIAVIVQRQIASDTAGVAFSANPQNGDLDEVMVNSNFGLGETVVAGLVTPDIYLIRDGKINYRKIADKQIAHFLKPEGGILESRPKKPGTPSLTNKQVLALNTLCKQVADHYGKPMDMEWAIQKGVLYLLQARPITSGNLLSWKMKSLGKNTFYIHGGLFELMPEPISPLFADFAAEHYSRAMKKMIDLIIPGSKLADLINEMVLTTSNGYGYLGVNFGMKWLWPIISLTPKMLKLIDTPPDWIEERELPQIKARLADFEKIDLKGASLKELWKMAHELAEMVLEYYTFCQVYLAQAYTSEGLFIRFYNKKIKPKTGISSHVFMVGEDMEPIQADKALYELAGRLKSDPVKSLILETEDVLDLLRKTGGEAEKFKEVFEGYLKQYGNMIYDLDFAKPTPHDHPQAIFEALKCYVRGEGVDPAKRQEEALFQRAEAEAKVKAVVSSGTWKKFKKHLDTARRAAPDRENGLAKIGLCQPQLRKVILETGERLKAGGILANAEDIFMMKEEEIRPFIEGKSIPAMITETAARRTLLNEQKKINPPNLLPKGGKMFGIPINAWLPKEIEDDPNVTEYPGIGVSSGMVTGTARVILSTEEFREMKKGDILVASMTTPAWTPLFSLAAGIVTDFGGPLSHSSIVAREYGIPAVLGTGGTSKKIRTGQTITVDGDKGVVRIEKT